MKMTRPPGVVPIAIAYEVAGSIIEFCVDRDALLVRVLLDGEPASAVNLVQAVEHGPEQVRVACSHVMNRVTRDLNTHGSEWAWLTQELASFVAAAASGGESVKVAGGE